jgi:Rrf2 family protein
MLRRVIAELEKAWLLKTLQGRYGGVQLAKEAQFISVFDILYAVWEELWIADCTKEIYCEKQTYCTTTDVLWKLQKWFNSLLKIHTLDKIIKK